MRASLFPARQTARRMCQSPRALTLLLLSGLLLTASGIRTFASPANPINTQKITLGYPRLLLETASALPERWFAPWQSFVRQASQSTAHPLKTFVPLAGATIPILIAPTPEVVVGGMSSVEITIQANQAGGTIQLGTDCPGILNSPSGAWPYSVSMGSSNSKTIRLGTNAVATDTSVTIYACPSGVDASDSRNWTAVATVEVRAS